MCVSILGGIGFSGFLPSGYLTGFSFGVKTVLPLTASSPKNSNSLSILYSTPSSKFISYGFESINEVSTVELKN